MHKKLQFEIGIIWKLNFEIIEMNIELHTIYKTTIWILKMINLNTFIKNIYLFIDNQMILKFILNVYKNGFAKEMCKNTILLLKNNYMVNFHWISGHTGIIGNDLADKLAKQALNTEHSKIQKFSKDCDYIKRQINENAKQLWTSQWNNVKKILC